MATINVIGTYHSRLPLHTSRNLCVPWIVDNKPSTKVTSFDCLLDLHPKEGTPEEFH